MPRRSIVSTPTFDRFGWYWQPAQWLENMSPKDARNATVKTTNIEAQSQEIKNQANKQQAETLDLADNQQKTAKEFRTNQEDILASLYDDN